MELELKWLCSEEEWKMWLSRLSHKDFYAFSEEKIKDISPMESFKVENFYFDTPTQSLKKEKMALRYRSQKGQALYTIKKTKSSSSAVEQREELERPYVFEKLDFNTSFFEKEHNLVEDENEKNLLSELLSLSQKEKFEKIAELVFERSILHLDFEHFKLELAFDHGLLYSGTPFFEVEFEFKDGQVDAFERFIRNLLQFTQKEACKASKLKRYLEDKAIYLEKINEKNV